MTTVCLTIKTKICVLFLFSFESNLGVSYMLQYECSNDRKSVKELFFLYFPISLIDFYFLFFLFNCIAWL